MVNSQFFYILFPGASGHLKSAKAFLFSIKNKDNIQPFKSLVYQDQDQNAIYSSNSYGPTFGGGHDLHISDSANSNTNSYTNFGNTYQPPSGYNYGDANTRALLAGNYHFRPSDVEVFYFEQPRYADVIYSNRKSLYLVVVCLLKTSNIRRQIIRDVKLDFHVTILF